jgi:hypothetical protein
MISSEVQRTLVKSPPELWAELSDPVALSRHLGELGDIRITRTEPERVVEWQAATTSGTVLIKPSGWGTQVTLSVTAELPAAESQAEPEGDTKAQPAVVAEAMAVTEPEPIAEQRIAQPEPDPEPESESESESESAATVAEPAADVAEPAHESRRGFFARIFRRRASALRTEHERPTDVAAQQGAAESAATVREPQAIVEPPATVEPEATVEPPAIVQPPATVQPQSTAQEPTTHDEPTSQEPTPEPPQHAPDGGVDLATELRAAEEAAVERVTAVLTAALDRLGAAHHRPFSRS